MQFRKILALPCGWTVSVVFVQPWPIIALIPGFIAGLVMGYFGKSSEKREPYIAPALRPKPTTIVKARIGIILSFGTCLLGGIAILRTSHFLVHGEAFWRVTAWYIIGSMGAWMICALATSRKSVADYNKWLSDMAPWEGL